MPETAIPQLADIRQVSDGWIKKYVLTYTLPDGSTYEYESASRKSIDAYRAELEGNARGERPVADAVCIVPQTADGKLLLIREFRYPLNSWCIAFPAGLTEPGEERGRLRRPRVARGDGLRVARRHERRCGARTAAPRRATRPPASPTRPCRWCSPRWKRWPTRSRNPPST